MYKIDNKNLLYKKINSTNMYILKKNNHRPNERGGQSETGKKNAKEC